MSSLSPLAAAVPALLALTGTAAADGPSVYMGARNRTYYDVSSGMSKSSLDAAWLIAFPSGEIFEGIPYDGLAGFDLAAAKRDVASGKQIGGRFITGSIHPSFKRAPDVTGLRLDGAYTYMSDPNDTWFERDACSQMVVFHADGTFVDRGIFTSNCGQPTYDPQRAPGDGTYEIRDYTVFFTYRDGHRVRKAVTGVIGKDPHADAANLFVAQQLWYRRTKPLPWTSSAPAGDTITFAGLVFKRPAGTVTQTSSTISFTTENPTDKTYCRTAVYTPVAATGTKLPDELLADWKDIVKQGAPAETMVRGRFAIGGGMGTNGGFPTFYLMFTTVSGSKRFSIVLTAPSQQAADACVRQMDTVISSIRVQ